MSCGLGAVVLVFMLVKHNVETKAKATEEKPRNQVERMKSDLDRLKRQEAELSQALAAAISKSKAAAAEVATASSKLDSLQQGLDQKQKTISEQREKLKALKKKVEGIDTAKSSDVLEDQHVGEQNYLIGLKVVGQKIAILVDASASMTDVRLLDIIRRKNGSAREKQAGPKWQRTKRIVTWLMARLPKDAVFDVIAFNGDARSLGPKGWKPSGNADALSQTLTALENIVPQGPTNLQRGLEVLSAAAPTNVYLITDGLPTEGTSNYKSLNPFADCSSLWGSSSTISGACRLKLFKHSIQSYRISRSSPINVILLPIEGDPVASPALWTWVALTGGLLISPAGSWP